jgi:hypothetical protein
MTVVLCCVVLSWLLLLLLTGFRRLLGRRVAQCGAVRCRELDYNQIRTGPLVATDFFWCEDESVPQEIYYFNHKSKTDTPNI